MERRRKLVSNTFHSGTKAASCGTAPPRAMSSSTAVLFRDGTHSRWSRLEAPPAAIEFSPRGRPPSIRRIFPPFPPRNTSHLRQPELAGPRGDQRVAQRQSRLGQQLSLRQSPRVDQRQSRLTVPQGKMRLWSQHLSLRQSQRVAQRQSRLTGPPIQMRLLSQQLSLRQGPRVAQRQSRLTGPPIQMRLSSQQLSLRQGQLVNQRQSLHQSQP
jgi:Fe2+ transport system protein FeoA